MNELVERILGVRKIARLLRLRGEDTIEEIVDQQPFIERPPGHFGHETGESAIDHMRALETRTALRMTFHRCLAAM